MNTISYIYHHLILPIDGFRQNQKHTADARDKKSLISTSEEDMSVLPSPPSSSPSFPSPPVVHDEKPESVVVLTLWSVILFFPKIFLLKPALLIWFIITFPLNLLERNLKSKSNTSFPYDDNDISQARDIKETDTMFLNKSIRRNSGSSSRQLKSHLNAIREEEGTKFLQVIDDDDDDDLTGGGELVLQKDSAKSYATGNESSANPRSSFATLRSNSASSTNNLSPTKNNKSNNSTKSDSNSNVVFGTKRMGRFLFPKKLIPKSILNSARKKKLVLDLDETLIHSVSRNNAQSSTAQGHIVEVRFSASGISTLYCIYKRPYCDYFLANVSKWYDLIIFTASMKEYADPIIDLLENSFKGRFIKRLYRNDCILRDGVGYIKDLSIIHGADDPTSSLLNEIILIDNSPVSYAMNVDNAIQVEGWINDPTDADLLNLLPFLEALRYTTNTRNLLSLKNGERAFNMD